jgi:hypothetical protein
MLLATACNSDGKDARPSPSPSATASASPTAACLGYDGPPDGSAKHPYLKRAMALDCREDVKRLQAALGIEASGHFDNATANAVIAKQEPYACISANDGQVGPQTWSLIVDGIDPCSPGRTARPRPSWATCNSATLAWALQTEDGTVVRRCGDALVLVHDGKTSTGAVQGLGSSACAQFDESFGSDAKRTEICVSDAGAIDRLEADDTTGQGKSVWSDDIADRYIPN